MRNVIRRVYVDTSVVGGMFDPEFERQTKPFWKAVQTGKIVVLLSDLLGKELENAPPHVRDFLLMLPEPHVEHIVSTPESNELADKYIAENVVGRTSRDDCRHIAMGTVYCANYLVSWNFKHIVNVKRIQGYNGVNILLGYPPLEIRTPYEVINEYN